MLDHPDMGARREWTGAGVQKIDTPEFDRIPPFDERSGDHLWTIVTAYKIDPKIWNADLTPILDRENLLSIAGPGCFYCEKPWSKLLASRRGTGNA